MKSSITTWSLVLSLLLQSVVWALPSQRAGQAERLAHEVAHAIDHGHHHHQHHAADHDLDVALLVDGPQEHTPFSGQHGPHHSHAGEGVQVQGLPSALALPALSLPGSAPRDGTPVLPPSTDPDGLLRPPRAVV